MTTKELFENLLQGKKMRLAWWKEGCYICLDRNGILMETIDDGYSFKPPLIRFEEEEEDWEVDWGDRKTLLTVEEQEYLEAVLRPFKDSIRYVEKQGLFGEQYIQFCYESFDTENPKLKPTLGFNLPRFKANTMYQGMDLGVPYTLRELGLFKNKEEK